MVLDEHATDLEMSSMIIDTYISSLTLLSWKTRGWVSPQWKKRGSNGGCENGDKMKIFFSCSIKVDGEGIERKMQEGYINIVKFLCKMIGLSCDL